MDADTERVRHLAVGEISMKVVSSRNVSAAGDCERRRTYDLRMHRVEYVRLFVRKGRPGREWNRC
jgi:hypothetical protein